MLPKNAVLYLPDGRPPNFYAPRPVVLTLQDLRGREPVYRLTLEPTPAVEAIDEQSILSCGATVYSNDDAIVVACRTPGGNRWSDASMFRSAKLTEGDATRCLKTLIDVRLRTGCGVSPLGLC
jgi:hypothetical protein